MPVSLIIAILASRVLQSSGHPTVVADVTKVRTAVSPYLYGIFFEEINCAGDGGIYAELIRNRSFEESDKPTFWNATASAAAVVPRSDDGAENAKCLEWTVHGPESSLSNDGYWGISVKQGESYDLSLDLRGNVTNLYVNLESTSGSPLGGAIISVNPAWKHATARISAIGTDPKARLTIRPSGEGTVFLDGVSLFPKTFNSRANGLRPDLARMLQGLKPGFMRFPGGCWVEGETMSTAMRWKRTLGSPLTRRTQPNIWQYISSNGLGFHEYLQMCEDIGAAPLFVINCGMSHREVVPMDQMGEFVDDALDAIEYANGDSNSKWGALRAKNGHSKPFGLKFMEIGNENGGAAYLDRYKLMYEAIHKAHPEIGLVADVWGGVPNSAPVDIVDEHYYSSPSFFFQNANRYDTYDRKGPKVYVGEYAVTEGCGGGNLIAAVSEAAFMCGMERNSDHVIMSSYAPLFANVNYKKWNPDLINFDSSTVYGTPSYHVQKMFATNRPSKVFDSRVEGGIEVGASFPSGSVGVGTWRTQAEYKDLQVIRDGKPVFQSSHGEGMTESQGDWGLSGETMVQKSLDAEGSRLMSKGNFGDSYTVKVKARKNGGAEGFLVHFGFADANHWLWWNIGGWQNQETGIELANEEGKRTIVRRSGHVETGRWYDLRVEVTPSLIRCYMDDQLIQQATRPQNATIHAVLGLDDKTHDYILKVVNGSSKLQSVDFALAGLTGGLSGSRTVLTSASAQDENSISHPTKVAPKIGRFSQTSGRFTEELPPCSVSVYRFKAAS